VVVKKAAAARIGCGFRESGSLAPDPLPLPVLRLDSRLSQ
jgi:hypothetical protein